MSATAVRSPITPARVAAPRATAAPYLLSAALFVIYACWSILRHLRLHTSGFDLGIFGQAVRGYTHLGAPKTESHI
jgi:predicted ABC-type sugar transport system permease subunit